MDQAYCAEKCTSVNGFRCTLSWTRSIDFCTRLHAWFAIYICFTIWSSSVTSQFRPVVKMCNLVALLVLFVAALTNASEIPDLQKRNIQTFWPPQTQYRPYGTSRKQHLLEAIHHIAEAGNLREDEVMQKVFMKFRPWRPVPKAIVIPLAPIMPDSFPTLGQSSTLVKPTEEAVGKTKKTVDAKEEEEVFRDLIENPYKDQENV